MFGVCTWIISYQFVLVYLKQNLSLALITTWVVNMSHYSLHFVVSVTLGGWI